MFFDIRKIGIGVYAFGIVEFIATFAVYLSDGVSLPSIFEKGALWLISAILFMIVGLLLILLCGATSEKVFFVLMGVVALLLEGVMALGAVSGAWIPFVVFNVIAISLILLIIFKLVRKARQLEALHVLAIIFAVAFAFLVACVILAFSDIEPIKEGCEYCFGSGRRAGKTCPACEGTGLSIEDFLEYKYGLFIKLLFF